MPLLRAVITSLSMRKALAPLLDLIFPPTCFGCRGLTESRGFCAACCREIHPLRSPFCRICGVPFCSPAEVERSCAACLRRPPAFARARAGFAYGAGDRDHPLGRAIQRLKYDRQSQLGPGLAQLLIEEVAGWRRKLDHVDVVIPVPLHLERLRWRGFNQSQLLASAVARHLQRPLLNSVLRRTKATPAQVHLGESDRRDNVRGAFAARESALVRGRTVLLVDDVMTTGATVDQCSRTLRRAGAREVEVLALARVPSH